MYTCLLSFDFKSCSRHIFLVMIANVLSCFVFVSFLSTMSLSLSLYRVQHAYVFALAFSLERYICRPGAAVDSFPLHATIHIPSRLYLLPWSSNHTLPLSPSCLVSDGTTSTPVKFHLEPRLVFISPNTSSPRLASPHLSILHHYFASPPSCNGRRSGRREL